MRFKRKPPYSQEEISEQIGQISSLIIQEAKSPGKLAQQAIETSREVLLFMLDEVQVYNTRYATIRSVQRHSKGLIGSVHRRPSVAGVVGEK